VWLNATSSRRTSWPRSSTKPTWAGRSRSPTRRYRVEPFASVDLPGVIPIALDITDPESVAAAARTATGVSLLINNAGSSTGASVLTGSLDDIRLEMDTHYFGTLAVTRAFAPQLAEQDGGAVLNVLSVLSWVTLPGTGAYSAAKSAEWSLTNALRLALADQGTTRPTSPRSRWTAWRPARRRSWPAT
jgi:NAD(P)-dependent dehydrogenase (short-subunit alcohol dehydrogenase family)